MDPPETLSRRRLLASTSTVGALAALAGCTEGEDAGPETPDVGTTAPGGGSDTTANGDVDGTAGPGTTDGSGTDELDLREANVVGVSFEGGDGTYTFDVTLHHDDDGEDGYANWWQVERLDGTQLGRRELLHAHSQQPFTRSDTVEIPADVNCVVVRGHDQTHGYGGVAMLVSLESGATRQVDQSSEPRSFEAGDCP
ncbi:hypothetical protein [Haloarchaeobius salinus]|uniref:hypothetical protein n=1 Tax=Haloarchaeobius salinus TaxID=1198298 RepID=UPI00210980FA|nr:hypothetical protein [Haloarchaeobius salinus]